MDAVEFMDRKLIAIIIIIGFFGLILIGAFTGSQTPDTIDKISELKNEGYNVVNSDVTFNALKEERIADGGSFSKTTSWLTFKQQIETTKENIGFVSVINCESDDILWIHATETQYYYYELS